MSATELYVKGARVWVPDASEVWVCGTLQKDYTGHTPVTLDVLLQDGEVRSITVSKDDDLPPLRNPEIRTGENDLTSLSYLHEPAVLHNLYVRFCNTNTIYTYCGIMLVAINPYEECPIYGPDTITAYRGHSMGDLDPHIFAVAEEAFTKMEMENRDQSIIVSGESGAGKTVSAKYTMRYFATVGGSSDETQIEKKVLASNPIMEAIGNAKTTRNDNSSRFGKYIELDFNSSYSIIGANMRTYLLEKSRVVFQAPGERNYHIFYQMCSSAEDPRLAGLKLGDPRCFHYLRQGLLEDDSWGFDDGTKRRAGDHQDNFAYLNQGDSANITGVDDAADFQETCRALSLLGMSEGSLKSVFTILAAILHLGNVEIEETSSDSCAIPVNDAALPVTCDLLKVSEEEVRRWLCHRKIVSAGEVFIKPITAEQATFNRDALAKHIYAQLFSWIVKQVNKCFAASAKPVRFIGVLDIYGFETFAINSFEQFCINYANEKLQQQFNQHVFKLEQEEYVKEQIEWEFINFYDNQPCINLIESKLGILDLLDEECRVPKGSDQSWVEKLYDKCKKSEHFNKPRLSRSAFIINHFADKVTYESHGFLEKNRDIVSEEHIAALLSSRISLVKELFSDAPTKSSTKLKVMPAGPAPGSKSKNKRSVGSQFRNSLSLLMETLNSTTPHYVRCIKPNDEKKSFSFDPKRAVQQLRACGVLETVRISAAGYPSRWTYLEFFSRYRVLCHSKEIKRDDMRTTCEKIITNMINDEDKFKFGRTKIFLRAGQVAYMEKLRADKLKACIVMIQKHARGYLQCKRYQRIKRATLVLQKYARGYKARRTVHHIRRTAAAVKIQSCLRGWLQRIKYKRILYTVIRMQALARGLWARQRYVATKRHRAAVLLQRNMRRYLAVQRYNRIMRGIVAIQGRVRCFLARKKLKKLKIEAKSVEHQRQLNKGLENKIISMQQKISEMKVENRNIKKVAEEAANLKIQISEMKNLESELKSAQSQIAELEKKLKELEAVVEAERGEKMDVLTEKEKAEKENREIVEELNKKNAQLTAELNKVKEAAESKEGEEILKRKLEVEKEQMLIEHEQEKSSYQKLLREFNALESKNDQLEEELARVKGTSNHKRTASSLSGYSDATTDIVMDSSDLNSIVTEDDVGYGSVRSRGSDQSESGQSGSRQHVESIDWESSSGGGVGNARLTSTPATNSTFAVQHTPSTGAADTTRAAAMTNNTSRSSTASIQEVTVVLQLQQKVRELQKQRQLLASRLETVESTSANNNTVLPSALVPPGVDQQQHARDMIRLQELEMLVAKLQRDNTALRKAAADDAPPDSAVHECIKQFSTLQDELDRRREECVHLRTTLSTRVTEINNVSANSYGKDVDILNEDGELAVAYQTQKQVNRQLTEELLSSKQRSKQTDEDFRGEVERLRKENERQQKLINSVMIEQNGEEPKLAPGASQTLLESEIIRLSSENLTLVTQVDGLQEQLKKYKKTLKVYARKLRESGAGGVDGTEDSELLAADGGGHPSTGGGAVDLPAIRKKERDYMGMFEYDKKDELSIIKTLIYELKPRVAVSQLPGLPAYILFMCIRHTDHLNDDEKVRSLMNNTVIGIKRLIKKRQNDLDSTVLWLSNTLRLLHNLKQYSGDKAFQLENTPKQNEQSLKNFDLSEYRQVLSDIAVWIYTAVIKLIEESLQPLVVPSILEHDAIPGLSGNKPAGMRGRTRSTSRGQESPVEPQKALDLLLNELTLFYRTLAMFGTDPELITQVFRQIFYYICAGALNNLLLRKDMCHWSKGMQIRYNVSNLEQWARDTRLQDLDTSETLAPIIQAAQLLQHRKTEEDVDSICEMCDKLTVPQIIKILNLYTPADDFEENVPASFIQKIQQKLQERQATQQGQGTLLMNTKFAYPVRFPFNPSSICLEDIELPDSLNLTMLRKV